MRFFRAFSIAGLLAVCPIQAEIPRSIPHQGRIASGGVNFDGTGQFKFFLFFDSDDDHASGNETAVWSNASTSPGAVGEPAVAVSIGVSKGLYGVWLGDPTVPGMDALPSSIEPGAGENLYLRIWFDDGQNGFQMLSPDQPIASVPFALHADAVSDGSITGASLAPGAVNSDHIEDGTIGSADLAMDAVTQDALAEGAATDLGVPGDTSDSRVAVREDGTVVLGDSAPSAAVVPVLEVLDGESAPGDPVDLAVENGFAYVISREPAALQIFDVSDPASIVALGSVGTGLSNPEDVAVSGDIAYVVDSVSGQLHVFDVADKGIPTALDANSTNLSAPRAVAVQGNFVYVADRFPGRLQIFGVGEDGMISPRGDTTEFLASPESVDVEGDFAYVADPGSDLLAIFDVSNPDAIVAMDTDATNMDRASEIVVSGETAYVTFTNIFGFPVGLQLFDVSDPTEVIPQGSHLGLVGRPIALAVRDGIAFVLTFINDLVTFDVSDPLTIVSRDRLDLAAVTGELSALGGVAVDGEAVYLANDFDGVDLIAARYAPAASVSGGFSVAGPSAFGDVSLSGALVFPDGSVQTKAASADQTLSLLFGTDTLSISNGNSVDLSGIDDQTLSLSADTLSIAGGNSISLARYFSGDGSEALAGNLFVSGGVQADFFQFPTTEDFTYQIPGNTMTPNSDNRDFFASSLGYIQQAGSDTTSFFNAPVRLPHFARVSGVTALFFDNTANSYGECKVRLRRRQWNVTQEENVAALDFTPPGAASTAIRTVAVPVTTSRARIDNDLYHYWIQVELNAPSIDGLLRFYGFRITYELQVLQP